MLTFNQALVLEKYRADQARDERGRFTDEGGGTLAAVVREKKPRAQSRPGSRSKPGDARARANAARNGKPKSELQREGEKLLARMRRANATASSRMPATTPSERNTMAINYARWLAQRDGITLPPGSQAWSKGHEPIIDWGQVWVDGKRQQRPKAVYFPGVKEETYEEFKQPDNYYSMSPSAQRYARQNPKNFVTRVRVPGVPSATIRIPNWDHVPIVTRGNREDYDD